MVVEVVVLEVSLVLLAQKQSGQVSLLAVRPRRK